MLFGVLTCVPPIENNWMLCGMYTAVHVAFSYSLADPSSSQDVTVSYFNSPPNKASGPTRRL
ncbi:hypothetical protein L210DRAFT_3545363 [Boletus edulis BED1]|uniref:Uncharacterized protein n=1 Tax=Boletus edulis BED1 TaxID=1328754 RepID=A0AAD4BRR0_BOLED|nr:hypothetical protein L210DRAFT_3545363 [Boletus edulis BED1]